MSQTKQWKPAFKDRRGMIKAGQQRKYIQLQARDAGQAAPMVRTAPTLATSVHDWHASPGTAAAGGASGPSYATSVGNWHASPGTAAATGASGPSYATSVHEWHPPAQAPAAQAPAAEPCAVEEPAPSPR